MATSAFEINSSVSTLEIARSNADAAAHVHSLVKNREMVARAFDGWLLQGHRDGREDADGSCTTMNSSPPKSGAQGIHRSIAERNRRPTSRNNFVADLVAPGIVHDLEWIEVDEQDANRPRVEQRLTSSSSAEAWFRAWSRFGSPVSASWVA